MTSYELPVCHSVNSFDSSVLNVQQPQIDSQPDPQPKAVLKKKKKKPKVKHGNTSHAEMWREHHKRVLGMESNLDTKAPGYPASRVTGVIGLRRMAWQYMERTKKNIQMLVELSKTMRTHGAINPFRYDRVYTMSTLPLMRKTLERIDLENHDIGKRILDVTSEIDTGIKSQRKSKKIETKEPIKPFQMPSKGLEKYKDYNISIPTTDKDCWNLLRPHIYVDIFLKGSRRLGRVVVQLYTESAPIVVLQMVRTCICDMHNKFIIKRIFPNLWMDVDLLEHDNTDLSQPLEYDGKIIDHGASAYVLSFSKEYLQGFSGKICFSISFKPLSVANGSRVGFGQVVKGSKILECLQSYGTKNGKLSRSLIFSGCGLL
ncbi:uncharacterized protein LOC111598030 [Drosophila hydei]|uniref:Uncharacterized protein LOC111598030 n=1 Tax=Drosophila hydei TaxID=7224 RepID=A0A6J1LXS6_DROHY|nr:uncharacterized protein LOC111598030 [Drosophila hydei]